MLLVRHFCFVFLLLGCFGPASGQVINAHNLNRNSGLPSNHVYSVTTDHLGYLWLCTDRGIARYNGYELKLYNVRDGLPSNDIWGLYFDRRHRLWLRTRAPALGYMANGTYHPVYLKGGSRLLYPRHISEYGKGIFFLTERFTPYGERPYRMALYMERDDTLYYTSFETPNGHVLHTNEFVTWANPAPAFYRIGEDGRHLSRTPWPGVVPADQSGASWYIMRDQVVAFKNGSSDILTKSLRGGPEKQMHLLTPAGDPDPIHTANDFKDRIYVLGGTQVHVFDSLMRPLPPLAYDSLTGDPSQVRGTQAIHFIEDGFWGRCISTKGNGLLIHYGTERAVSPLRTPGLADFTCIGAVSDRVSCWVNPSTNQMAMLAPAGKAQMLPRRVPDMPVKVLPYDATRSLLLFKNTLSWFAPRTGSLAPFDSTTFPPAKTPTYYPKDVTTTQYGILLATRRGLYLLQPHAGSFRCRVIHGGHFYQIGYDSTLRICWARNDESLFAYRFTDGRSYTRPLNRERGLLGLQQLLVHGASHTVLVQDFDHLYRIHPQTRLLRPLFRRYNLQGAQATLRGDQLVVAGSFGILFSRITGANTFSEPVVYPNVKHGLYRYVEGLTALPDAVLLQTDQGVYRVSWPSPAAGQAGAQAPPPQGRLVVEQDGRLYGLPETDTLAVPPGGRLLRFDAVNPRGNGPVVFRYRFSGQDTICRTLPGRELALPEMKPRSYHTLSVSAADLDWNSGPQTFVLYQEPTWWQTDLGYTTLVAGSVLALAALLSIAILVTRSLVQRQAQQRQWRTELELRAMHSQINPHFIFNTLNSSLYFIRKNRPDDAAAHISRFSHLLRGYLDSSSSRHIPLEDEATNLRNYIELQQTRFAHRFTYAIQVDEALQGCNLLIPSLLLQPLVENAIDHGLVPYNGSDGHLTLRFEPEPDGQGIRLTVDDNGVGRQHAHRVRSGEIIKRESHGSRLTQELIDVLNRHEKMGIRLRYIDKTPPASGTTVVITIKNPRHAP